MTSVIRLEPALPDYKRQKMKTSQMHEEAWKNDWTA